LSGDAMARKAVTKLNDYKLKPQYSDTVVNVYPNITTIPLNPNHIYIANSVLGGSYLDTKNKPNYLRAPISSNIVTVVGEEFPLYLVFALGKDDFGEVVNAIICIESDFYVEVPQVSGGYYIYAEYNYGQIIFGYSNKTDITYSKDAPSNPADGEYWFTYEDNCMYMFDGTEWVWINRIILGWVGVGADGNIYSLTTFPFHYGFAKFNPEYIYTEVTGNDYLKLNYEQWINNLVILDAVFRSEEAMNAVCSYEPSRDALYTSEDIYNIIIYYDRAYRQLICSLTYADYNLYSSYKNAIIGEFANRPLEPEWFINKIIDDMYILHGLFSDLDCKDKLFNNEIFEIALRNNETAMTYLNENFAITVSCSTQARYWCTLMTGKGFTVSILDGYSYYNIRRISGCIYSPTTRSGNDTKGAMTLNVAGQLGSETNYRTRSIRIVRMDQ
jgi:hypothetical protein